MIDALPFVRVGLRITGWVLVHFIWQCGLLGLLYALARNLVPRGEARYRLGMLVLIVLALCPLATLWHLLPVDHSVGPAATVLVTSNLVDSGISGDLTVPSTAVAINDLLPWLVLAWLLGVCGLSIRAWRQWRGLKVLIGGAESIPLWQCHMAEMAVRFGIRRRVRVLCSSLIDAPLLVGWLKPIVLLPVAVAVNFPVAQVNLIFAHELAHLRRSDPIANLFQVILETLHFYHPVLHWISRDVRNEREICCDRLALSITGGSPYQFARALTELGELREKHGAIILAANGGVLFDRVQQMVAPARNRPRAGISARLAAIFLASVVLTGVLRQDWEQAQLQQRLTASLLKLNAVLELRGLPVAGAARSVRLSDLVPKQAKPLRPLAVEASVSASTGALPLLSAATMVVAAIEAPHRPELRIIDLKPVRDNLLLQVVSRVPVATEPAPVHIRRPLYPKDAVMQGVEGKVTVEFEIAEDGSVQAPHVIQAKPAGVFDQAAELAMRGWKYAAVAEAPGNRRHSQVFVFTLNSTRAMGAPLVISANAEVPAQITCQISTGTNICRLPENERFKK